MSKVAIVTDSTACLPRDLAEKHGIRIVPMSIIYQDRTYQDEVDINPSEVYRILEKGNTLPTTSAPSPGAYIEAYRELSQVAESILCITLAQTLSTVFQSAMQAKEMVQETLPHTTIAVIDSHSAAGSQGLIALAAARAAAAGQSLEEVIMVAEQMADKVYLVGIMDSLFYLARGGRMPKTAARLGDVLKFKPIFTLSQGKPSLLTAVRTKSRGVERMLEIMRQKVGTMKLRQAIVMHANVLAEAERLKERIAADFDGAEVYVKDFSPVMGIHTGPGLLGIAFFVD